MKGNGRHGAAGVRSASGSERPHPADERLFIVHNASQENHSNDDQPACSHSRRESRVWPGASRAEFAGITNKDPKRAGTGGRKERAKRGKVAGFSDASRRYLQRTIATVRQDMPCLTTCLSLPARFDNDQAHEAFRVFCRRFEDRWGSEGIGGLWKREIQQRGAVHYHFVIWGAEGTPSEDLHQWMAGQWFRLVGDGDLKHLSVHSHHTNWTALTGNFSGYFSRYLGKEQSTVAAALKGRWWGAICRKNVPFVAPVSRTFPERINVRAHRIARKVRQKNADRGKHAAASRCAFGREAPPIYATPWRLQMLRQGFVDGWHNPSLAKPLLAILRIIEREREFDSVNTASEATGRASEAVTLIGSRTPALCSNPPNGLRSGLATIRPPPHL